MVSEVCFFSMHIVRSAFSVINLLQARGPKKHLKRLNAPKAWMLDKLGGVYAPRPSTGPHKLRESLPLVIFLRNRLKYALTNCEVKKIVMQRLIKVDGKVRTDPNYPAGFMGMCVKCNAIVTICSMHCMSGVCEECVLLCT